MERYQPWLSWMSRLSLSCSVCAGAVLLLCGRKLGPQRQFCQGMHEISDAEIPTLARSSAQKMISISAVSRLGVPSGCTPGRNLIERSTSATRLL